MEENPVWRSRAKASLEAYFRRRSFPRLTLSLLLVLTGVTGFLISYGMLRLGVAHMWVRYPIAVRGGYGVLLASIRTWVEIERSRFDPEDAAIVTDEKGNRTYAFSGPRRNSWFDWLDIPNVGIDVLDEGCLPAILVGVIIVARGNFRNGVDGASSHREVFLDAFIVTALLPASSRCR